MIVWLIISIMGGHSPVWWVVRACAKQWSWMDYRNHRSRIFSYLHQALAYCLYFLEPRRFHSITIQATVRPGGDDEEWVWRHDRWAREFREPLSFGPWFRENREYFKEAIEEQAVRMQLKCATTTAVTFTWM